jgi:16S rRNA (cytosine967-C5)-methyltransferase
MNAREAAYRALLGSMREERFISEALEQWRKTDSPSARDLRFAREMAYGAMRKQKSLNHYAKQLAPALKLKRKERALLYLSLYQAIEMDKIPIHAVVNESVKLGKKECHARFADFLNAILQKIPNTTFTLPQGSDAGSLAIRYSYTDYYVQKLLDCYGLDKTIAILEASNAPGKTMARIRANFESLPGIIETPFKVALLENPQDHFDSPDIYIQNAAPVALMGAVAKTLQKPPGSILDMCASPGGKALLAHDLYPGAKLTVNDVSEYKLLKVRENFKKYGVDASYSVGPEPLSHDLIIVDAPCSNSGVLNKRPEARWRITEQSVDELRSLQKRLLRQALDLLNPGGIVWYMTCSILPDENQELIKEEGLWKNCLFHKVITPNSKGWDGGFACALSK